MHHKFNCTWKLVQKAYLRDMRVQTTIQETVYIWMARLIALTAVDGAGSTAKEAASHGGCKDSSDRGDKLLQPR